MYTHTKMLPVLVYIRVDRDTLLTSYGVKLLFLSTVKAIDSVVHVGNGIHKGQTVHSNFGPAQRKQTTSSILYMYLYLSVLLSLLIFTFQGVYCL